MFLNLEKAALWKIAGHSEHRTLRHLLLGCVALALAACAGQKSQPQPQPPIAAESPAAQLQHWTINGKLGVRSPGENGSANLQWWQRNAQNYRIHLSGPLGAGTTVITGTPAGVTLQKGSEVPLQAASPAELTAQILGWPLPVAEMYYWVRGMAAPGAPVEGRQQDSQGQLQSLRQAGWHLNFSGYRSAGPYVLPTRIVAETRQAAGPVKVTLVIKEWLPQN